MKSKGGILVKALTIKIKSVALIKQEKVKKQLEEIKNNITTISNQISEAYSNRRIINERLKNLSFNPNADVNEKNALHTKAEEYMDLVAKLDVQQTSLIKKLTKFLYRNKIKDEQAKEIISAYNCGML